MHLKKIILAVVTLFISLPRSGAQDQRISDSLKIIYETQSATDTARLNLLLDLSFNEIEDLDLALEYADELITLSGKMRNDAYIRAGYFLKGTKLRLLTHLDEAQAAFFTSAELARKMHSITAEADSYGGIASVYAVSGNHDNAVEYYQKAIALLVSHQKPYNLGAVLSNLGDEFLRVKLYDSALTYFQNSSKIFDSIGYRSEEAYSMGSIGVVYANTGKKDSAETYLNNAIKILEANQDFYPICEFLLSMSQVYLEKGEMQEALQHANRSLELAERHNLSEQQRDAFLKLSEIYDAANNPKAALSNYQNFVRVKDTIDSRSSERKMYNLRSKFDNAQKQAEIDRSKRLKNLYKIMLFSSLGIVLVITTLIAILFRNYRQKQKAFTMLSEQKTVIEHQRDTTDKALQELKQAQAHLIHSEKMASLGQLTAGIAHEIQNPLNFVNNFSDLNTELVAELYESLKKGNYPEAETMAQEIMNNETKISLHGKRAEAIVKGMLEHSRSNASEKRPVNINGLVDEYIRLAVHGFRAKDKTFNVSLQKDFDPAIPELNIVPQEIGRVILNLLNNAFYAVNVKNQVDKVDFIPLVSVTTKIINGDTMIAVKDNGIGIPVSIRQKIFQPFFTTKSPGVGTGLGLSLSYDILKAHGGEMKVESEEGTGSEFVIVLPI